MSKVAEKFLRYVQVDTASDINSPSQPSTHRQVEFGTALAAEMRAMGLTDAHIDEHGYVYATLPGNIERPVPVIGLIAHMDVVADVPSANVRPQIVRNYDGGDTLPLTQKRA